MDQQMDPLELEASLEVESDKMLSTKMDPDMPSSIIQNDSDLQVGRSPNTIQYVRIDLPEILLQKSLSQTNSANVDQYLYIKNENQVVKSQKPVTIKQNCQPVLVPKSPTSSPSSISPDMVKLTPRAKTKRDEMRRYQHNQIEKARREKINSWIMELGSIIPESFIGKDNSNNSNSSNNNSTKEALSKSGILATACEYITHLKTSNLELNEYLKRQQPKTNEKQSMDIKRLLDENEQLKLENVMLKRKLTMLNIDVDLELDIETKKVKTSPNDLSTVGIVQFVDSKDLISPSSPT